MQNLSRRLFLAGTAATVATTFLPASIAAPFETAGTTPPYLRSTSLRAEAARAGVFFGAAVSADTLDQDDDFAIAVASECNILVPENDLKWDMVRPSIDRWDFTRGDRLLEFAVANGMAMRGHCLVWHEALPSWAKQAINADSAMGLMEAHIHNTVSHYRGKLIAWDVVNEAIQPKDGRDDHLRDTPWLRAIGPSYIDQAFRFAAEADPDVKLIYNDYGAEFMGGEKADAILGLVRGMQQRKIPLHGVGIQAHLRVQGWIDHPKLTEFCRAVKDMGLELMITELDVQDEETPDDFNEADRRVTEKAQEFLDIVMAVSKPTQILTWGLSDRYSWLERPNMNPDRKHVRPLPLDSDNQRTPFWWALHDRLAHLPRNE